MALRQRKFRLTSRAVAPSTASPFFFDKFTGHPKGSVPPHDAICSSHHHHLNASDSSRSVASPTFPSALSLSAHVRLRVAPSPTLRGKPRKPRYATVMARLNPLQPGRAFAVRSTAPPAASLPLSSTI
ncbi:hypothetical protein BC567DRAFT_42264 [Phyllosticta citribraziliensis]